MRASTLFGITVAILLGLGAVVAARHFELFGQRTPAAVKQELPKVLVAKINLFEGVAVASAKDTHVRSLTAEELDWYKSNKDKLMPPAPEAAQMRVVARNIEANQILLKEDFQDQALPQNLTARLQPGMRSVELVLPRERAAGGVIKIGEKVDVYLTTTVFEGNRKSGNTSTACVARDLKVIVKRDNLWTVMQPIPADKPVAYTLQANPYRAALIEFTRHVGEIAIVPSPGVSDKEVAAKEDSKEYRDELSRVTAFLNGELAVGERDLERIFNLQPRPTREPPLTVEMYSGVKKLKGYQTVSTVEDEGAGDFSFYPPGSRIASQGRSLSIDCPTCDKIKKK